MLLVLAALTTLAYALVNGFGAWMVVRRKPWVAGLFLLAASVLVVAFASFVFRFPYSRVLLASGLILASLASFLNAHVILGNVVWRYHLLRASVALAIYGLAHFGLP